MSVGGVDMDVERTVEIVLGCRVIARVERHADTFKTVVVSRLKGGRAACRDRASLERKKTGGISGSFGPKGGRKEPRGCNSDTGSKDQGEY